MFGGGGLKRPRRSLGCSVIGEYKINGRVHPKTGHEGPEWE